MNRSRWASALVVVLAAGALLAVGFVLGRGCESAPEPAGEGTAAPPMARDAAPHRVTPRRRSPEPAQAEPAVTETPAATVAGGSAAPPPPPRYGPSPTANPSETPNPWRVAEPTAAAEGGGRRVVVTDDAGQPREGARVLVYVAATEGREAVSKSATTGPDGKVEFAPLSPGNAATTATWGSLSRTAGGAVVAGRMSEVSVVLPAGAIVEGVVRHVEKGPLAGIQVATEQQSGGFTDRLGATTDENGRYRLVNVPPGTHIVSFTGPAVGGYHGARGEVAVPGPGTYTRDFVLGAVSLEGFVRDAVTNAPIPGAKIQIQNPLYVRTTTDSAGAYRFLDLPTGEFPLVLEAEGYELKFDRAGPTSADTTRTQDFLLRPAAVLVVELTDAESRAVAGEVILGVNPRTAGGTNVTTNRMTDESGRLRFPSIVAGEYDLTMRMDGFEQAAARGTLRPGAHVVAVRRPRRPGAAAGASGAPALSGPIRDAATNEPIAGVRVNLQGGRPSAVTDAEGRFELRGALQGPVEIFVSKEGWGIRFVRRTIATGKPEVIEETLDRAATLHLWITDPRGKPVSGQLVLGIRPPAEGAGGPTRIGTSIEADAGGHAVYRQVVPGRYQLRVLASGVGGASVETEIVAGENTVSVRLE